MVMVCATGASTFATSSASAARTSSAETSSPKRASDSALVNRADVSIAEVAGDQQVLEFLQRFVVQLALDEEVADAASQLRRGAAEAAPQPPQPAGLLRRLLSRQLGPYFLGSTGDPFRLDRVPGHHRRGAGAW